MHRNYRYKYREREREREMGEMGESFSLFSLQNDLISCSRM